MTRRGAIRAIASISPVVAITRIASAELPYGIHSRIRQFNPSLGDTGRGCADFSVAEVVAMMPELHSAGFTPFHFAGAKMPGINFLSPYAADGSPTEKVWFGFPRKVGARDEIISFHMPTIEMIEYLASRNDSRSLYTAFNQYWSQA